ncbi:MATE family efflux transporter [Pseudobutyrivibrio xylanivorans]|uniref:Probable multidrug resistance protein NorM n=1 Tax=Pseudobutyrivibrio xylanivorans TaxID=185007 RepID=A0A5P6VRX6_PSEXY|nr:MATE family efflux transporter [Pseudobutyrivibrio xylanivorans]QFJ55393.1 MATE family efflux transporter [Pseudobutyrivibrio xylanivorans]
MAKIFSATKKRDIDFTQGSPFKLINAFFWPLFLTSMLQQVYNFVDTLIVGKGLGDNALAAVGNMGSLFFLIVGFSFGLANGFAVLIAQSYGAKDEEQLRRRLAATIELGVILAIVLSTISLLFLSNLLTFLNTDEVIMKDSLKYGYIVFGGLPVGISYNIAGSILRSFGDSRTPLKAIVISSILNLTLDSFFIFGLGSGVEGAAIATVVAQVVSVVICINSLRQIEMIKLKKAHFINSGNVYYELLKNGLPMAIMNSITAVGCMVVQAFVNGYGVVFTASYSVCSKYLNLFMNPAATTGSAITAYTSQNYGAKEYGRIKEGVKVGLGMVGVFYLILGSIMVFLPAQLADFLLDGKKQIELVCIFLPRCGVMLIFLNILFIVRATVQGMGKPMLPMFSGILEMILRTFVISFFISRIGFKATPYAEISAWLGALFVNAYALYIALVPLLKEQKVALE